MKDDKPLAWKIGYVIGTILAALVIIAIIGAIFYVLYPIAKFLYALEIKKVIFNDPATIVLWVDGTKTVVKAKNEVFDPEKGLAMAIAKKAYGNKGSYFNRIKKWIDYDDSEAEDILNDLDSACKLETSLNNVSEAIKKRMNKITSELDFFLNHAPIEADCTAKENKMFSDMANLKNSIEDI